MGLHRQDEKPGINGAKRAIFQIALFVFPVSVKISYFIIIKICYRGYFRGLFFHVLRKIVDTSQFSGSIMIFA